MSTSPVTSADPAAVTAPETVTRWAYVGLLLACGIGSSMQVGKVPPALGAVQRDLHLGLVGGAWVISMFSIVGAALGCLAGSAVDRMGPHRAATGGLFGIAAASVAGSFAQLPWVLLASRALEGMAFVVVVVAIPSLLVASASQADRRFVPALWGIYMPIGMAISLATAQSVLLAYGWRVLWQIDAAVLLLLGVGLLLVPCATAGLFAARALRRVS
jgi:MFS family permease